MQTITVTGAYGRDYKKQGPMLDDWLNGKDFQIQGLHRNAGRYMSIKDSKLLISEGIEAVSFRFDGREQQLLLALVSE